ncbi:hypothetical protein B0J13DRAFT_476335, partial [Dactylonectria estremocensis]
MPMPTQSSRDATGEDASFNRLANRMNSFHEAFRRSWSTMYTACSSGTRPAGMSIRRFISIGLEFCENLENHHNIEENWFFPLLAERMPEFRRERELVAQHREIHAGLEALQSYLRSCLAAEVDFSLGKVKEILDSFGVVLWQHLGEEVQDLKAENMRKYWTREEIDRIPM